MHLYYYASIWTLLLSAGHALPDSAPEPPPLGTPTCLQPFFAGQTMSAADVNVAGFSMLRALGCPGQSSNTVIEIGSNRGTVVNTNGLSVVVDHNNNNVGAIRTCTRMYQMFQSISNACIQGNKIGSGGFVEDGEVGAIIAANPPQANSHSMRSRARRRRDEPGGVFEDVQNIDPNAFATMTRPSHAAVTSPPTLGDSKLQSKHKRQVDVSTTTTFTLSGDHEVTVTWRSFQTNAPVYVTANGAGALQGALRAISSNIGAGLLGPIRNGWMQAEIFDSSAPSRAFFSISLENALSASANQQPFGNLVDQINSLLVADWQSANAGAQSQRVNVMEFEANNDDDRIFSGSTWIFALPPLPAPPRNNLMVADFVDITKRSYLGWGSFGPKGQDGNGFI